MNSTHRFSFCLVLLATHSFAIETFQSRPKILVRGWGPPSYTNFSTFKGFLAKDGVDKTSIHEISYHYGGSRAEITKEVGEKLTKAISQYPLSTRVDLFGHSLGSISSLLGIAAERLGTHIQTYVSFAGIDFGQAKYPTNCWLGWACGDIFSWMIPFKNKTLLQWHQDNASELSFKKCSVWTKDDELLTPKNAGVHEGELQAEVAGVSHVDITRSERVYRKMKEVCFASE